MEMNRKLIVFIATSLDGFIAREDESLDWLFKVEGEGDNGYSDFYETVDTILMGRKTYDWVMKHENGKFPYENKECYVFSRTVHEHTNNVTFVQEDPVSLVGKLKRKKGDNIWLVGGGELIHSFLKEKLIDELIVTIAPVLIGTGIRLFKEGDFELELKLKNSKRFNQFVELHYEAKQDLK